MKDVKLLERIQKQVTKMIQRQEHLSYEGRLRKLVLFNLGKTPGKPHCGLSVLRRNLKQE